MANRSAVSLVTELSSVSRPSISEIVNLFSGLHEQRSINNFVRVFKTTYSDNPLISGHDLRCFGSSSVLIGWKVRFCRKSHTACELLLRVFRNRLFVTVWTSIEIAVPSADALPEQNLAFI